MSAPLTTYAVTCGIYYGSYFNIVRWLRDEERVQRSAFCSSDLSSAMLAGSIAGLADMVVSVPVEMVKTAMQAQVNRENQFRVYHRNSWQCAKFIYANGGIKRLYRGTVALTCRDMPSNGLYFYIYESLAHPDSILRRSPRPAPLSLSLSPENPVAAATSAPPSALADRYTQLVESASPQRWGFGLGIYASASVAGAIAGPVSWAGVVPFDVVKNRLQADPEGLIYKNMSDCIVKTYRREGWRIFWRGSTLIMMSSLPYNAVTFAAYEVIIRLLSGQNLNSERYRGDGLGYASRTASNLLQLPADQAHSTVQHLTPLGPIHKPLVSDPLFGPVTK